MKKLVPVPILSWQDVKVGSFYKEGKVYRKILQLIEEGGEKKAVVSYHVWTHEIDPVPESFLARDEFKKPCYKFGIKDFTMFGCSRVTFTE